jgi:hypothetical protein
VQPQALRWALKALRTEWRDFWFPYPFDLVPGAGPRDSLHYYVFSDRLSWDAMRLDPNGVPLYVGRLFGATYSPSYIAWYGLVKLEEYLRGLNPSGRDIFMTQVSWLAHNCLRHADGTVVWTCTFDWQEGDCFVKAPWPSAIAQGHAISALIRAYRITRDETFLALCLGAANAFRKPIPDGGIRALVDGHILYAEYPTFPTPRIMDGFLTGLLGLYDLYMETRDPAVFFLFHEGIDGVKYLLPYWSYRDTWTWYGSQTYLCTRSYHTQNYTLLKCLAGLSEDRRLAAYADAWDVNRMAVLAKIEVFLVFLFTKNAYRLRHRTWKQHTVGSLD